MPDTGEPCFTPKVKYPPYKGDRLTRVSVDDMFLKTTTWDGGDFRISTADLATHIQWQASIGSKLPAGSNYTIELGHNGNGNIEVISTGPLFVVDWLIKAECVQSQAGNLSTRIRPASRPPTNRSGVHQANRKWDKFLAIKCNIIHLYRRLHRARSSG
jgi:hypothetical protein